MKKYNDPCDIVIIPNLKEIAKPPHTKEYNNPTMKIPFMLIMFLLCLEVFNKNGDLSVKFVFVPSNVNMQIIYCLANK